MADLATNILQETDIPPERCAALRIASVSPVANGDLWKLNVFEGEGFPHE